MHCLSRSGLRSAYLIGRAARACLVFAQSRCLQLRDRADTIELINIQRLIDSLLPPRGSNPLQDTRATHIQSQAASCRILSTIDYHRGTRRYAFWPGSATQAILRDQSLDRTRFAPRASLEGVINAESAERKKQRGFLP